MDSATARRICQSPDSVIAGKKECVLLDQSLPRQTIPRTPARRPWRATARARRGV